MKQVVLFGCAILTIFMLAGSATAGNQIDTDDIYIMAYYDVLYEIDLSSAIKEFDHVSESTGQYVEGTVTIWHNYPNGRDTGSGLDLEIKDGVVTDIPFSTDVTVRVKSDGWIVAWLTNEQDLSNMVFWNAAEHYSRYPLDTTLGQAIWRITDKIDAGYDKNSVEYYSYKYPYADRLLIGGRTLCRGQISSTTYHFLIPSMVTIYEADLLWTSYLENYLSGRNNHGIVKIDNEETYNKNTTSFGKGLYDYARYSYDVSAVLGDTQHTIYMEDSGWRTEGRAVLQSAVALLYKAG